MHPLYSKADELSRMAIVKLTDGFELSLMGFADQSMGRALPHQCEISGGRSPAMNRTATDPWWGGFELRESNGVLPWPLGMCCGRGPSAVRFICENLERHCNQSLAVVVSTPGT